VRSVQRLVPWFALGTQVQHRDQPQRQGPVRPLWYGAAPYLLSIMSVAAALAVRLLLQRLNIVGASEMRMTLFLYAIAVSAWYLGAGPGLVAAILSTLTYNYFLSDSHSLSIAPDQVPFYVAFLLFAVIVTRFTAVRRRVENELVDLRDGLQKEVMRSESYLVEAQRLSRTGSFGWSPASGTIYWSEETYRIFGIEPGKTPTLALVVERTHPDDRAAVQATIESAQRDGADFEHKYRLLMPDGSLKHLHVVAHAVADDAGRREFVGAVMDITERERAEEELRESEDRFRTFVDYATDAFFLHDDGLLVIDVNRQACASLGYSRDELIGKYPLDYDVGLDEAAIGRLTDRFAAGENVTFESLHRRKDGAVFPVEVRTGRFQRGGRLYRLALARDITERKRTEAELSEMRERYRILTESSLTGIYLTEGTRFVYVNPAMAKTFGYTVEELVGGGGGSLDLTCPDDRHLVAENMRRRLSGEAEELRYEFRGLRKDGSVFPVEVHGRRIELGGKVGVLGTLIDNTERERARRLEQEQQSAIAVERARLAGEIHDTLAQGLAMIVMQLADAEAKLGPAWARAEKPLGLVRELAVESLAYARRSVTMLQPSAPAAGLARAIRDVVDSTRRHSGATLNFAVTGDAVLLPATVESALAGIAREALANAARHSGAGRVDVELAFQDAGAVRLAVADDGVGFDAEHVRSDGYGLTSMQDRAARAGVALTFVTEPGAGTEVVASWSP
jgi:PAS domain S-box-containing protein